MEEPRQDRKAKCLHCQGNPDSASPRGITRRCSYDKKQSGAEANYGTAITVKTPDIAEQWQIQNAAAGRTWDYQIKSKIVACKDQSIC